MNYNIKYIALLTLGNLLTFCFFLNYWNLNINDFFIKPYIYDTGNDLIYFLKYVEDFNFLKTLKTLNYPLDSNFNLMKNNEYFILFVSSVLMKFFPIHLGLNIIALLGNLLAFTSSFIVMLKFRISFHLSFFLSLFFATGHFIFLRQFEHITLTYIFIVPILIYILYGLINRDEYFFNSKLIYSAILLLPLFNIYFITPFTLLLITLLVFDRDRYPQNEKKVLFYYIFLPIVIFFILNLNSFWHSYIDGHENTIVRSINGSLIGSLNLSELFLSNTHFFNIINDFSNLIYFNWMGVRDGSSYLGLIPTISLLFLIINLAFKKNSIVNDNLNFKILISLIIILIFSLSGGINLLISTFNFGYLRSSNRFSIYIYYILIIYFALNYDNLKNKFFKILLLFIIFLCLFFDNFPKFQDQFLIEKNRYLYQQDIIFGKKINNKKIFVLPPMLYPESPMINNLKSYTTIRPSLFSNSYFSSGGVKGNGSIFWQNIVKDHKEIRSILKRIGYDHVLINKNDSNYLSYLEIFEIDNLIDIDPQLDSHDFQIIELNNDIESNLHTNIFFNFDYFLLRNDLVITNLENEKIEITIKNNHNQEPIKFRYSDQFFILNSNEKQKISLEYGINRVSILPKKINLFNNIKNIMSKKFNFEIEIYLQDKIQKINTNDFNFKNFKYVYF